MEVNRENIEKLPRWAQVVLAARSAWRVLVLVRPQNHSVARRAVRVAESAAEGAANVADARAAANAAYDAADADHGGSARATRAAAYAAYAACAAYTAAVNSTETDSTAAANAVAAAVRAGGGDGVGRDLALLESAAKRYAWTDDTPIEFSPLGSLWPDGEPDLYRAAKQKQERELAELEAEVGEISLEGLMAEVGEPSIEEEDPRLLVEIEVPEGATDEQVIEYVRALSKKLNAYHLALGGGGLTVEDLEVFQDSRTGSLT